MDVQTTPLKRTFHVTLTENEAILISACLDARIHASDLSDTARTGRQLRNKIDTWNPQWSNES